MNSSVIRPPSEQELSLLTALVCSAIDHRQLLPQVDGLQVAEMNDGGMGSLLLFPLRVARDAERHFGGQVAAAEFADRDGVLVSVALNLDKDGFLFELDLWKVDFSPLQSLPDALELRICNGGHIDP